MSCKYIFLHFLLHMTPFGVSSTYSCLMLVLVLLGEKRAGYIVLLFFFFLHLVSGAQSERMELWRRTVEL